MINDNVVAEATPLQRYPAQYDETSVTTGIVPTFRTRNPPPGSQSMSLSTSPAAR